MEDENKTVSVTPTTLVAYIEGDRSKLYSSLQAAINVAQTGSNKNVIVIPGNTINIKKNLTIPKGVNVYVPFEEDNGTYKWETQKSEIESLAAAYSDANADSVTNNRKTLINLTNGADIIIDSGGYLYLGGQCGGKGVVGAYTEINLSTGSKIDCSGSFYCFGYVKENSSNYKHGNQTAYKANYDNSFDEGRLIKINSGGYFKSVSAMYGVQAATSLLNLDENGVFPINLFDFPNLQTYTEISNGASFVSQTYVLAKSSLMNVAVYEEFPVVASSSALFNISSGNVAFEYCPNNIQFTNDNGLTRIFINGNLTQGALSIYVDTGSSSTSRTITTQDKFFPISYKLNLYVNDGGTYSSSYQLKFYPGSSLKINKGGKVNVYSDLIFYEGSYYSKIEGGYSNKTDSVLINNGTLKVSSSGKIAALIQTEATDTSATLDFSECADSSSFTVTSLEGETGVEIIRTSNGYFVDDSSEGKSSYQFKAKTIVNSASNGTMCWDGDKNDLVNINISIATTTFTKNIFAYQIFSADDSSGTNSIEVTSGVQNVEKSYPLAIGKYVNIVVTRSGGATFNDGTSLDSSKWYSVNQDIDLTITPLEGIKLTVKTDGTSGNGQTSFTVTESSTQNGVFSEIITWTGIANESTYLVKGWYFKISSSGTGASLISSSKCTKTSDTTGASSKFTRGTAYLADDQYTVYFPRSSICFTEGTLITLANGVQKAIENISLNDNIMSFNHHNGYYEAKSILFVVNHGFIDGEVMVLKFSNGRSLELVGIHSLFNLSRKEYVNISIDNYNDYIGDEFLLYDSSNSNYLDDGVKLETIEIVTKSTRIYSIVSKDNVNAIANGILSNTPYVPDTYNIFELDNSLKYDPILMAKDIEKYGLYEYEEFKEYIPKEIFDGANLKYYKVAIEKGLMTEYELMYIMSTYKLLLDNGEIIL